MKEEQSKQDVRALFHFFSRNIREQLLALPLEAGWNGRGTAAG